LRGFVSVAAGGGQDSSEPLGPLNWDRFCRFKPSARICGTAFSVDRKLRSMLAFQLLIMPARSPPMKYGKFRAW
jgi:hypothetical protein